MTELNETLWKRAEKLAARNYTVQVAQDESTEGEPMYLARTPELRGCKGQGKTIEEAVSDLADARIDYIYFLLEDGFPVPEPEMLRNITTSSYITISGTASTVSFSPESSEDSHQLYEVTLKS